MAKKRRAGWVAVAFAAVIALAAGTAVVKVVTADDEKSAKAAPTRYKLTLPKRIFGGKYHLVNSSNSAPRGDGSWNPVDVSDWQGISGDYTVDGGRLYIQGIIFSGIYGDIKRPDRVREALLRGATDRDDTVLAVRPRTFDFDSEELAKWEVKGSPVTVSCQVVVRNMGKGRAETTLPVCAWAEDSVAGVEASTTPGYSTSDPEDVDLEQAALAALNTRAELRRPVG